eukprot:gene37731-22645_t
MCAWDADKTNARYILRQMKKQHDLIADMLKKPELDPRMRKMGEQTLPILELATEKFWTTNELFKVQRLFDPTEYPMGCPAKGIPKWDKKVREDTEELFYEKFFRKNLLKHGVKEEAIIDLDDCRNQIGFRGEKDTFEKMNRHNMVGIRASCPFTEEELAELWKKQV